MPFSVLSAKGMDGLILEAGVDPQRLTLHISEIAPGTRAHPPHTHEGIEAFYVLQGQGTVEYGAERQVVGPNQAILLGADTLHGLVNTGDVPLRYMVIIARG